MFDPPGANGMSHTLGVLQSVARVKESTSNRGFSGVYKTSSPSQNSSMEFQSVASAYLRGKVDKYGRRKVAEMLEMTTGGLDFLRAGERKKENGTLQPVYISVEHLYKIAKAEGKNLLEMFADLMAVTAMVMTMEEKEREKAEAEGVTSESDERGPTAGA